MDVRHVFAGIPVREIGAAREWYGRLFGREPDLVPNDVEACWEVREGAWVYVLEDAERAGHAVNTLLVADLDDVAIGDAALERKGGMRTAWITDPDGNRIQFGDDRAD
jgi:hypothetical protein